MASRRDVAMAVLLGAAGLSAGAAQAAADAPIPEAEALAALYPWIDAVAMGDRAAVERLLAPEFQILRSDGIGYTKAEYLNALPQHQIRPVVSDMIARGAGGSMVLRYEVAVDEVINGRPVQGTAPRLSALRREGDRWLMVAHANFARIG